MKNAIKITLLITTMVWMSFTQKTSKTIWFTKTGKVTFFSHASMEDIKAINNQATVAFNQDNGDISARVPIKSFLFKKKLMQEHFNENYMESDKFPHASFKGKILNINKVNFKKDSTYKVKCKGKLTMHGVTREVSTSGKIKIKGAQAIIDAEFHVLLKDYNIKKPAAVQKKIADKIKVTLHSACKKLKK